MKPSYRLIDYSLRPGKFAERKILCEIFSRLRPFSPLQDYQYVGFGSIWFADHMLFHKSLGIRKMVSIERVRAHTERFKFNRPYANVDIRIGAASQHLTSLDWDERLILWLDYDDSLSPSILDDARTVAARAESGMMLAVSVQANKLYGNAVNDEEEAVEISTPQAFWQEFGDERTPPDLEVWDLKGWKVARISRAALLAEVEEVLVLRNVGVPESNQLEFRQVAAFEYADNAKITTIVGIFVESTENSEFESCGFDELEYYRSGTDAVQIKVPMLTPKEMRHLDSLLPGLTANKNLKPIPAKDAKYYSKFYRYLPNYASFEP